MRQKQVSPLLLVCFFIFSCSSKIIIFKTIDDNKEVRFKIAVPKKHRLLIVKGSHEKEYNIIFPDSSTIFISDNVSSGSFVNREKYTKYGKDVGLKFLTQDTLKLNGVDEAGQYWEERKMKNLIYGYIKVSLKRKLEFDNILNSLTNK